MINKVRNQSDIAEIEREGLAAFLPQASPFELIEATAQKYPDKPAIRYLTKIGAPEQDVTLSYADFARKIRQAANLFHKLGVGPNDAVAILAPHVLSTQIALWAAEITGRACPINPMLAPEHVVSLLRAAGARIAIVLGENGDIDVWSKLAPHLRESGLLSHILDCDAEGATSGSDGSFEALLARESADHFDFTVSRDGDAIAAFFHTGGTTGAPKLALHTRGNQAFVGRSAALMYDLGPDDVLINGFPLFHVAGAFVYGLSVLAAGGTILIPTRLGMRNRAFIETVWKQVEHYGVTAIGGVPTVMSALIAVGVDADISRMRLMLTGGSPLPTELADAFERVVKKPVRNILGMTECAGVVTIEPFHGPRVPGSTGLALAVHGSARFSDGAGDRFHRALPARRNRRHRVARTECESGLQRKIAQRRHIRIRLARQRRSRPCRRGRAQSSSPGAPRTSSSAAPIISILPSSRTRCCSTRTSPSPRRSASPIPMPANCRSPMSR